MPGGAPCQTENTTGMARSILAEVARMLADLADRGTTGSINLRSLPLTEADREQLEELLGRGEVTAELELAGRSTVWETAYAGAWWIRHRGAGDKIASEEIAICPVPEILITHPADIESAALRIKKDLQENHPTQAEASNG
jgi:hydrogenase-1 operon protein HyaF